jgi:hypothetical protein
MSRFHDIREGRCRDLWFQQSRQTLAQQNNLLFNAVTIKDALALASLKEDRLF